MHIKKRKKKKKKEKAKIGGKKKKHLWWLNRKTQLLPSYKIDRQITVITPNSIQEQEV